MLSAVNSQPGLVVEAEDPETEHACGDQASRSAPDLGRDPVRVRPIPRSFARSRPSIHDARPAVSSAPARPMVGDARMLAVRNEAAYSRAVMFLPRMCQYIIQVAAQLQPSLASPTRHRLAAASSVSSAAWMFASSAMPRSSDASCVVPSMPSRISRATSAYRSRVASARSRPSRPTPRAARRRTRRSSAACRKRSPSTCTSALSTSDSRSSRTLSLADRLEVGERAAAGEDRHAAEQPLLRLRQQRVAPVDRGAQCLLAFGRVARPRRQHLERMVEPLEQRLGCQEPQPRGRELERERQPVEAPADRRRPLPRCWSSARMTASPRGRARRRARTERRLASSGASWVLPLARRSAAASWWS